MPHRVKAGAGPILAVCTYDLFNLTVRPKLGPKLVPVKSLLNCHPDGRAAAAQVQSLEEVGEGVFERRRDGRRGEEVLPAEAFKIPGRNVTREIQNVHSVCFIRATL